MPPKAPPSSHSSECSTAWAKSKPELPFAALPSDTYHDDKKLSHFFNGEAVILMHQPAAHTDGE